MTLCLIITPIVEAYGGNRIVLRPVQYEIDDSDFLGLIYAHGTKYITQPFHVQGSGPSGGQIIFETAIFDDRSPAPMNALTLVTHQREHVPGVAHCGMCDSVLPAHVAGCVNEPVVPQQEEVMLIPKALLGKRIFINETSLQCNEVGHCGGSNLSGAKGLTSVDSIISTLIEHFE